MVGVGKGWGWKSAQVRREMATKSAFLDLQTDPAGKTKKFCKNAP